MAIFNPNPVQGSGITYDCLWITNITIATPVNQDGNVAFFLKEYGVWPSGQTLITPASGEPYYQTTGGNIGLSPNPVQPTIIHNYMSLIEMGLPFSNALASGISLVEEAVQGYILAKASGLI